tara:strand:+ start:7005 stop:8015 length:1011 start_codon:yes stop_codon:yes gene_type:complete
MTDRNKFEEMLERLVNEDRAGAEELFHEIVVEKSREIYQNIIESDDDEEVDEAEEDDLEESDDEEVDESEDDELEESVDDEEVEESEDDDLDEMFGLDQFEAEDDPMADMGGDATDDMMGDLEMGDEEGDDEEGDDEGGEGPEAALGNLEDALDALKAEFEKLMGSEGDDEEGDDHEEPDADQMGGMSDMDADNEEEPEESSFQATITPLESRKVAMSAGEQMREYVEKVAGKMGDNGVNTKSIVAGKNDMGGTTANIAKSKTEAGVEANKGQLKGNGVFKGTAKVDNAGNVNVPGAKGATKMSNQPGHGAEKKGKPETADKSAGSMLNGAPKRAK